MGNVLKSVPLMLPSTRIHICMYVYMYVCMYVCMYEICISVH